MLPFLRAFAFVAALLAGFLFLVPIQALARRRGWPIQHKIQTGFCRAICATIGIRVTRIGALPARAPRFIVSNHVSWTDVIALASLYPLTFLAKSEVAQWPVLGFLARLQGTVFVPRGSRADIPRVNAALFDALAQGRNLVVFPEGTSSAGSVVLPFKPAHFDAIQRYGGESAIAPVAISYTDGERAIDIGWYGDMTFLPHLWRLLKCGEIGCRIAFGEAIAPADKDRKALAAESEARVRTLLDGLTANEAAAQF